MIRTLSQVLIEHSSQLVRNGLHRKRILPSCRDNGATINFSSSDYLSLTRDLRISKAFQRGFANYPSGSGSSMVICGYHPIHKELEQAFSQALGADDALLF